MDTIITRIGVDSVPELITSVAGLFAEDGGKRDRYIDTAWPKREGTNYYANLLGADRSLCLLAYARTKTPRVTPAGHLIGRIGHPNALRPNAVVAVLESMRVKPDHRRQGVGTLLMEHFYKWAQLQGATEASVTAYATNNSATEFYRHQGFTPFELTLHLAL
jgi:GNAT superfamily N-acetyltransferase